MRKCRSGCVLIRRLYMPVLCERGEQLDPSEGFGVGKSRNGQSQDRVWGSLPSFASAHPDPTPIRLAGVEKTAHIGRSKRGIPDGRGERGGGSQPAQSDAVRLLWWGSCAAAAATSHRRDIMPYIQIPNPIEASASLFRGASHSSTAAIASYGHIDMHSVSPMLHLSNDLNPSIFFLSDAVPYFHGVARPKPVGRYRLYGPTNATTLTESVTDLSKHRPTVGVTPSPSFQLPRGSRLHLLHHVHRLASLTTHQQRDACVGLANEASGTSAVHGNFSDVGEIACFRNLSLLACCTYAAAPEFSHGWRSVVSSCSRPSHMLRWCPQPPPHFQLIELSATLEA
ncbi:hypothetical protein MAPG_04482 [Magnaporthiopsis poae ATCC 64411]|uniref:Uncharacterized protein n=1 Tax=Magnaporthiopsis poae (strain ATCC 64411 / 73-15) TaxID=644358 RepID=A0A0C4DWU9_MAGP6|nr:hypothetical protein MAPG_04482 [Magnaporthiopsis poae ATCC 64411]